MPQKKTRSIKKGEGSKLLSPNTSPIRRGDLSLPVGLSAPASRASAGSLVVEAVRAIDRTPLRWFKRYLCVLTAARAGNCKHLPFARPI